MIDKFLNKVTMYRLVIYVLGILVALSIIFSFLGRLAFSPTALVISLTLVISSAYVADRGLSKLFDIPTNRESFLISALIIFLIVQPGTHMISIIALLLAGAVSSASKFLIVWRGSHIFNPAAFAASILSLFQLQAVTWWIGSTIFWPASLLLGLLVVRKVRKFPLFVTFAAVSIGLQALLLLNSNHLSSLSMKQALIASPLIFLSTIMLTEPATMPPRRNMQMVFAAVVALFYVTAWQIGPLTIYPEVALLLGNIFVFIVSPKTQVRLRLHEIQKISDRVYGYVFQPERPFSFLPGQYMELTMAGVPYDSRGNRRTFTIASSPTEKDVHLGVKFYEPASMFKAFMHDIKPGDIVFGSQVAGNFTLAGNETKKLAFIAGGIGVTPFRSMIKYLSDRGTKADIVLVYAVSDPSEFAYGELFNSAQQLGIKIFPLITNSHNSSAGILTAKLNAQLISRMIPDYNQRLFYVSGPDAMVDATKSELSHLGISNRHINTDHFSGY